jgi:exopolysaccharide biosynthesis polyprenyl glycosylphosphotransferase
MATVSTQLGLLHQDRFSRDTEGGRLFGPLGRVGFFTMANFMPTLAHDWSPSSTATELAHHSAAVALNAAEPTVVIRSAAVHLPRGNTLTFTIDRKRVPLTTLDRALKRTLDLFGTVVGLVLLSPLLLTIAVLIKLESRGPILFTQWRSGFNGQKFRIFKFRSMMVLEDGPVIRQAKRDDPRFTPLGRLLRRTSIDELPQLFNVLRGEMSLVGPRPHAIAHDSEFARMIAEYGLRYGVKPGITGWAQVNGYRGETGTLDLLSKRVEFDLWYIENWSIWLDLKIIFGTLTSEIWRLRGY